METTEKKSLFEITSDLLALNDLLEEVGGDLTDERAEAAVEQWMATLAEDQGKKLDGYGYLIARLEMEQAAAKEEAERWQMKARSRGTRAVYLKKRLFDHMQATGQAKIETPAWTFAIQGNGGQRAINVTNESLVPMAFKQVAWTVDTAKLRQALEVGEQVEGAELMPRGSTLRIR